MFYTLKEIIKTAVKEVVGIGTFRSYGQYGEDARINSLLRGVKKGFYVDVGCYHPHLYSITYPFYKRGWNGIAIDPNPLMGTLFRIFRPRDTFINAGIGLGEKTYERLEDAACNKFSDGPGMKLRKLSDILAGVQKIDLLNIDVEGMDLEVLTTHDWSIKPTVIAVEARQESRVQAFLENKGYQLKSVMGLTLIFKLL